MRQVGGYFGAYTLNVLIANVLLLIELAKCFRSGVKSKLAFRGGKDTQWLVWFNGISI